MRVTTLGLDRLHARITRRANFLSGIGLKDILRAAGDDLLKEFKKNIATFTPGPVRDLKPATKVQKQRQVGFIYPILHRTGDLIRSMHIRVVAVRGLTLRLEFWGAHSGGTLNSKIAEVHITGQGVMPVRDFTKIPPSWVAKLKRNIREALRNI